MRELPSEITAWADEIRTVYSGTLAVGLYPQFRSQLVVDDTFIYSPRIKFFFKVIAENLHLFLLLDNLFECN